MTNLKLSVVLGLNSEKVKKRRLLKSKKLYSMVKLLRESLLKKPQDTGTKALLTELDKVENKISSTFSSSSLDDLSDQIVQISKMAEQTIDFEVALQSDEQKNKELEDRKSQATEFVRRYVELFTGMNHDKQVPSFKTLLKTNVDLLNEIIVAISKVTDLEGIKLQLKSAQVIIGKTKLPEASVSLTDQKNQLVTALNSLSQRHAAIKYAWRDADFVKAKGIIDEAIKALGEENSNKSPEELNLAYLQAQSQLNRLETLIVPRKLPLTTNNLVAEKSTFSGAKTELESLYSKISAAATTPTEKEELVDIQRALTGATSPITTLLGSIVQSIDTIEQKYKAPSVAQEAYLETLCSSLAGSLTQLRGLVASPIVAQWDSCPFAPPKQNINKLAAAIDAAENALKPPRV